jgi:FixJ family two-component response regulator
MKIVEARAENSVTGNRVRRISIVDDDASIRDALKSLMRSAGYNAEAFASAEEFLASEHLNDTACLILDVHLPGMSGFELQNHLNIERPTIVERPSLVQRPRIPIVFITAHADETLRQRALKGGAIEFLAKPVRREPLFRAIRAAIEQHREA